METEHPQDREDRITGRILAVGAVGIAGFLVAALIFFDIPSKNEILLGTVVGFVFGNMVGPVYRKVFGGLDPESRKAQVAQGEALSTAVASLATSAPAGVVQPVLVVNEPQEPIPTTTEEKL